MYEIQTGVARPQHKMTGGNSPKYPLARMQVDSFIVVPQSEMLEGDTPAKFRNRVNQAVRTHKQKVNRDAVLTPDYNAETYAPVDFTVLLLGAPPQDAPQAWQAGDVGVWRDS